MKKFITRSFIFVLITITICIIIIFIGVKTQLNNNLELSTNILILGDSNSEVAINDSIYHNSLNLSYSSDSYYYSYLKLKSVTQNSKVDTLILSFSPHNIYQSALFNKNHMYFKLNSYFKLMNLDDFLFLLKNEYKWTITSFQPVFKNLILSIIGINKDYYLGRYFERDNKDIDKDIARQNNGETDFYVMSKSLEIINHQILYLNKIISLCKEKNIELYLINFPKHKILIDNKKYGYNEFIKYYNSNLTSVKFIDLVSYNMPNDHFSDIIHLNKWGANDLSKLLESKGVNYLWEKYKF